MPIDKNSNTAILEAQRRQEALRQQQELRRRQEAAAAQQAARPSAVGQTAKTTPNLGRDRNGVTGPIASKSSQLGLGALSSTGKTAPLSANLTIEQLQGDPKLAARVAQASVNGTPTEKAQIDALMRGVVKDAALAGAQAGKSVPDVVNQDLTALAQATGLGASLQRVTQGGLEDAAKILLDKDLPAIEVTEPGNASLLGVLQSSSDPATQDRLKALVEKVADDSLTRTLGGIQSLGDFKPAMESYQNGMKALAEAGLGGMVQDVAKSVVDKRRGDIDTVFKEKGLSGFLHDGGPFEFINKAAGAVGNAVNTAVTGTFHFVSEAAKKWGDAFGTAAQFAIHTVGKVTTFGLDLAAGTLDAVGLDGAAKTVRKVDDKIEGAYDAAGRFVHSYAKGVGDATGDAVEGFSTILANPYQTAKSLVHLGTHPREIVEVGKAFWQQANEGGIAHAFGYVVGNLAPAILSGGSSTGATAGARLGAIARSSKVISALEETVQGTKAAQLALRAKDLALDNPLVNGARDVADRLRDSSLKLVNKTPLGKLRLPQGSSSPLTRLKERHQAFNTRIDETLARKVQKFDDTAIGRSASRTLEKRNPRAESVEAARTRIRAEGSGEGPVAVNEELQGLTKAGSQSTERSAGEAQARRAALSKKTQKFGSASEARGVSKKGIQRFDREGSRLRGSWRAGGMQPDIQIVRGRLYRREIGNEVRKIRRLRISDEEKAQRVLELVHSKLRLNTTAKAEEELQKFNKRFAKTHRTTTEDILGTGKGIGDCRTTTAFLQMALEDVGLKPGFIALKSALQEGEALAKGAVREADGLTHYLNVVEIDGKHLIFDAFNPALSGKDLARVLEKGVKEPSGRVVHLFESPYGAEAFRDPRALSGLSEVAKAQLAHQQTATEDR